MERRTRHHRRLKVLLLILAVVASAFIVKQALHNYAKTHDIIVVRIPMKDITEIRPAIATGKLPRSDSFEEMASRMQPYAAVNGTFYNMAMQPLGDILINGKLVNRGIYNCAIAFTRDGRAEFIRRGKSGFDWTQCRTGVSSGPMLVCQGKVDVNPEADGFKTMDHQSEARRTGIGVTADGVLLLVVSKAEVNIDEFAQTMHTLGAVNAINLDGGPASGLYCEGHTLVNPRLRMTNIIAVYKRTDKGPKSKI
jgi:exopolysaccharide biosynthesis protein